MSSSGSFTDVDVVEFISLFAAQTKKNRDPVLQERSCTFGQPKNIEEKSQRQLVSAAK